MPIRIKRDDNQGSYTPRSGGGGGGGGGIGNLIPILIGLFGRNPKMLLIIAIVGGILYFAGGKGCNNILPSGDQTEQSSNLPFSLGASFDQKKYESNEIYEPLSNNISHPLPESYSLLKYAPERLNQGQQGSCVAWASAYAARSIMRTRETGGNPNENRFSPAFLYNQIALENCQGSYLTEAMKVMKDKGLAPYEDMPYSDDDCSTRPNQMQLREASDFKITGYQRLTGGRNGEDASKVNMLAIKQNIAQGAPVVIGMMVGGSFMQGMMGKEMWRATEEDLDMRGFGGHAMCVIGYDDYKYAQNMGGFQIMNSWGKEWGQNGVAWVSYDDFEMFVKEAYGIYPMSDASSPSTNMLTAKFGIVLNKDGSNLSLTPSGHGMFTTSRPMKANEEFKLECINNIACHVYVFGQETDGTSYTLFPYTEKHSPYCGITGRRLFPRDYSMYPDEVGHADYFAIVVSKNPIDYKKFNTQLSKASGNNFAEKVASVVNGSTTAKVNGNQIEMNLDFSKTDIGAVVIETTK